MPQSHAQIYLHLVWSTKHRHPFLADEGVRCEMHRMLGSIAGDLACTSEIVGGVADHVHQLLRFGRTLSVADLVKELKRQSSIWVKSKGVGFDGFHWQVGYGAFSVSASSVPAVRQYIANQEEHHRERSFEDEYRLLLKKHSLEWDERYVWD